MKLRKILRIIHRDFGYFIVGMTIVYTLSGIILNHRNYFNPDYLVQTKEFTTNFNKKTPVTKQNVINALEQSKINFEYRKHYINKKGNIKVFIKSGEAIINPQTGKAHIEILKRRPVFFEMNRLHQARAGVIWKWVNDLMASILLLVAVTGLFLLKGKRSFMRWGWWLTLLGIVIPLFFVVLYVY